MAAAPRITASATDLIIASCLARQLFRSGRTRYIFTLGDTRQGRSELRNYTSIDLNIGQMLHDYQGRRTKKNAHFLYHGIGTPLYQARRKSGPRGQLERSFPWAELRTLARQKPLGCRFVCARSSPLRGPGRDRGRRLGRRYMATSVNHNAHPPRQCARCPLLPW